MEALRVEVERIAASRALSGLPSSRAAAGSLSDLAHVNRVQGLTLGFGGIIGLEKSRIAFRPWVAYGTSDHRLIGSLAGTWSRGATRLSVIASRRVSDFSDLPVIAPLMNSILAQEGGRDYGDYVLVHAVEAGLHQKLGGRTSVSLDLGIEESRSVVTTASPATGSYRANPALGSGTYRVVRIGLDRAGGGIGIQRDLQGRLSLEAGEGPSDYLRATAEGRWSAGLGPTELLAWGYLGVGTARLPPYRSFVLGGRGTLVGEPFRAYGGREAGLAHLEWRFEVPAPAISLGSLPRLATG